MTEIPRRQTLRKQERLHEKKILDSVFLKGNFIHTPPIKLLWIADESNSKEPGKKEISQIKAAFTVPKRVYKNAVTRNLLKRRMREAYRKNKITKMPPGKVYALVFIYTAHKINPYPEIESKIVLTLQHFKTATGAE